MGRRTKESWVAFRGVSFGTSTASGSLATHPPARRRLDHSGRLKLSLAVLVLLLTTQSHAADRIQADRIVVFKSKRTLILYKNGKELQSYRIALGGNPVGPKTRQGDHRTPEGVYRIDAKNSHSRFHLALHVSYPNEQDRARAGKLGVDPGGDIMIHGLPDAYAYLGPLHRLHDWTEGCIALTNSEIEEIWKLVPVGTPVEIRP